MKITACYSFALKAGRVIFPLLYTMQCCAATQKADLDQVVLLDSLSYHQYFLTYLAIRLDGQHSKLATASSYVFTSKAAGSSPTSDREILFFVLVK